MSSKHVILKNLINIKYYVLFEIFKNLKIIINKILKISKKILIM